MFCDQTQLKLKAGRGGNGCIAFRREKYIAKGGPNGGDGGKGGDLYLQVNTALNTLTHLDTFKQFSAENGEMGKGNDKHGRNGKELTLEVPLGTLVYEIKRNDEGDIISREEIMDLNKAEMKFLILKGGKGGYGNAHFVSSIRQAPRFAEQGEDGEEIEVELELQLVADIGIIGIPSAGKSTLISVISNAKPKIAEYHFTTLVPHLGVVKIEDKQTYVVADIPGLIEGASSGKGLGFQFLKHIQRCRMLVHLIDPYQMSLSNKQTPDTPGFIDNFYMIDKELQQFSKDLHTKKQYIVLNKSDIFSPEELEEFMNQLKAVCSKDDRLVLYPKTISAATTSGIQELKYFLFQELKQYQKESVTIETETPDHVVYRPHKNNPKHFSIRSELIEARDDLPERKEYTVNGQRIEQILNMTDTSNKEAMFRVYDVLKRMGITRELKKSGIQDGDRLSIGKKSFRFIDYDVFEIETEDGESREN